MGDAAAARRDARACPIPHPSRDCLRAETVLTAAADLIDSTARRLEDSGVTGTLLQEEWAAIQQADQLERDDCLVAAAWGQDAYDTDQPPSMGPVDWASAARVAPRQIGYERARRLRLLLSLDSVEPAPVEELLTVTETQSHAPVNIDGLVRAEGPSTVAVVVGAGTSPTAKRFASARAIGRHSLSPVQGLSLLTRAARYTERIERAFAAELLAPADGITDVLAGDFSEDALQRAAEHFDVNPIVVQHQVENQIAA